MSRLMAIGEVAERSGESADTIRYYERIGLLPSATRTAAGYRQFSAGVISRLALVRNAQRFGFSLREIAGFVRSRDTGGKPCREVRAGAQRMLDAVDQQIKDLVSARRHMRLTLKAWDRHLAATPASQPAYLLENLRGKGAAFRVQGFKVQGFKVQERSLR